MDNEDMMEPLALRNKLGHCKTRAMAYIAKFLKTKKLNEPFQSDLLKALMMHSPKKPTTKILSFSRRPMPPYNTPCLTILTKSYEVVTVSWRQCVEKLYGTYNPERNKKLRILQAFREDVAFSPKMMHAKGCFHLGKCSGCDKLGHLHIDHDVKPFAQILDEFLQHKRIKLLNVKVNYQSKPLTLQSPSLSQAWVEWHDHHATLIGLCKSCNCSKGSSGYKHKK